jgi:hypothetical protein
MCIKEVNVRLCIACGEDDNIILKILICAKNGLLLAWFIFNHKDGGDIFFRNVGWLSTDYTALYTRSYNSYIYFSSKNKSHKINHILTPLQNKYGKL